MYILKLINTVDSTMEESTNYESFKEMIENYQSSIIFEKAYNKYNHHNFKLIIQKNNIIVSECPSGSIIPLLFLDKVLEVEKDIFELGLKSFATVCCFLYRKDFEGLSKFTETFDKIKEGGLQHLSFKNGDKYSIDEVFETPFEYEDLEFLIMFGKAYIVFLDEGRNPISHKEYVFTDLSKVIFLEFSNKNLVEICLEFDTTL